MIRLKRVYEPPCEGDGHRVLVDRLWPRGLAKDRARVTLWLKEVAPSPALRKWFGHDPARWAGFRSRYRAELAANPEPVARLRSLAEQDTVTLLYGARDGERSNAAVLKGYLEESGAG